MSEITGQEPVRKEAQELKGAFEKLYQGSKQGGEVSRLKSAASYKADSSRPADEELEDAALAVHAWLSKQPANCGSSWRA